MPPKRQPSAQPDGESHSKAARLDGTTHSQVDDQSLNPQHEIPGDSSYPLQTPYASQAPGLNQYPYPPSFPLHPNYAYQPHGFQPPHHFQQAPLVQQPHQPTSPSSSQGHTMRGRSRRSVVVDDGEVDAPELVAGANIPPKVLYGTLQGKIVGIQFYKGLVNLGEKVICCREPTYPYDNSTIRVDDATGKPIGRIPAKLTTKISRYVDRNEIVIEVVITGEKSRTECPVCIYFFGTSDPLARQRLEERLVADKLLKAAELESNRNQEEAQRDAAMHAGANAINVGFPGDDEQQEDTEQGEDTEQEEDVEQQDDAEQDLLADSEAVNFQEDLSSVDAFPMDEDALSELPMAHQPHPIQSQLLPYQLQGLAWMIAKEHPQLPAPGSKDVVQLWKRTKLGTFVNMVSKEITKDPPELASGGVLADDMGLGKTLQIISLIMSSGFDEGPTLIVAPVGVLSNWEQQISHHVKDACLPKIFRYHKPGNYSSEFLASHDIVITTYDKVRGDHIKWGPLFSIDWRRIVLDEAHVIRNHSTSRAKAAFDLTAESRWMLSGTPIVNSARDFLSVLKFLGVTGGIEETRCFTKMIDKPLSIGRRAGPWHKLASKLLQLLSTDLCLRRRKDMKFVDLKLPPKTEYIHRIKFREDEEARYHTLVYQTTELVERYQNRDVDDDGRIPFSSIIQKLLRLRQMCCHWTLCGNQLTDILRPLEKEKVVVLTPQNVKILQQALLAANDGGDECPICMDPLSLHEPIITTCKHLFGRPCISKAIEGNGRCPMCRQPLEEDDLVGLGPVDIENKFDGSTRSSKTEALEKILRAKLKDPESKIVVFSQWTSFLNIIARLLDEGKLKYCRLEGTMSAARRDESIGALTNDPDTRIMLASLAASSVGLNLVAADTVILADSWWAPAIEDQAVDRVYRLGQTRPTSIWKLVVENTVEERILGVQAKKRRIARMALQDNKRVQHDTSRIEDVTALLSSSQV